MTVLGELLEDFNELSNMVAKMLTDIATAEQVRNIVMEKNFKDPLYVKQ